MILGTFWPQRGPETLPEPGLATFWPQRGPRTLQKPWGQMPENDHARQCQALVPMSWGSAALAEPFNLLCFSRWIWTIRQILGTIPECANSQRLYFPELSHVVDKCPCAELAYHEDDSE